MEELREKKDMEFYASLLEAIHDDRKDIDELPDNLDGQKALLEGAKALRRLSLFKQEVEGLEVIDKTPYPPRYRLRGQAYDFGCRMQLQDVKDKLGRMME